ncbi:fasciclin domain-containing protein, partial [Streptomyces chryseus]
MMTTRLQRLAVVVAGAALLPLSLTACSGGDGDDSGAAGSPTAAQESAGSSQATAGARAGPTDKPKGPAGP